MNLENGKTKTEDFFIIQESTTGWYVSNRTFGGDGLRHLTFTPYKESADKFSYNKVNQDVINSILESDFDLKVIKITKTIIEFDNEEEINNDKQ
ncbi:hypothetical protein [Microbulbifer pacificus]|uniref:hypothetical protein n=1 Tax=Microbulbifer pacificus TaxID=407164 RepID=UPI00131A0D30|nr:hypothetical protein [Microbulbifer pacificus]